MSTFLQSLEDEWERGQLRDLEVDLEEFVRKHAHQIREAIASRNQTVVRVAASRLEKGLISDQQMIDLCVRAFLHRCGTINPKKDVAEQCKQIKNEVWYEGERTRSAVPENRQEEIAQTWAHLHAAQWREWRLREILFTWEKKLAQFIQIIADRGSTTRRLDKETTARRERK